MLHLQYEETHTSPVIPSEPTLTSHKDLEVVEHNNVVEVDCLDQVPSRRCPIMHLALQQCKFPTIMLIIEHKGEDNKKEQVTFAQQDNVPVLESFIFFSIGTDLHAIVCLSYLLIPLVSHMHGRRNQLVRRGNYFNEPINGFV